MTEEVAIILALLGIICCAWLYLHGIQKTLSRVEKLLILMTTEEKSQEEDSSSNHTDSTQSNNKNSLSRTVRSRIE